MPHAEPQTRYHAELAHGRRMLKRARAMHSRAGQAAANDHIQNAIRNLRRLKLPIPAAPAPPPKKK